MGSFLASRRRLMALRGRPMVMRRQTAPRPPAYAERPVRGIFRGYSPEQITQGMLQGDASIALVIDDLYGWTVQPWPQVQIVIPDSGTWIVQGALPVYDGAELIGHNLHVRGGQ